MNVEIVRGALKALHKNKTSCNSSQYSQWNKLGGDRTRFVGGMSRIIIEDVSSSSYLDTFKTHYVFHETRPPQLRAVREFTTYKGLFLRSSEVEDTD